MNQDRLQRSLAGVLAGIAFLLAITGIYYGYKSINPKTVDNILEKNVTKENEIVQAMDSPQDADPIEVNIDAEENRISVTPPIVEDPSESITNQSAVTNTNSTNINSNQLNENSNTPNNNVNSVEENSLSIVSFFPSRDSKNIPLDSTIEVTLSDPVKKETLSVSSFNLKLADEEINTLIYYDETRKTAVLIPSAPLSYGKSYTVTMTTGIQSIKDSGLDKNLVWNFTTILPKSPVGLILADFENGVADGWLEDAVISNPGYESNYSLSLQNIDGMSVATKKIYDSAILKDYETLELDIDSPVALNPEDASAVAFEQEGEWKWVSLNAYHKPEVSGWQHISIPLSDFIRLDQNKNVSYLLFRFWDNSANKYLIDNITLTGKKVADTIEAPTDLQGKLLEADSTAVLSWNGSAPNYNIYMDDVLVGSTDQLSYSIFDLVAGNSYDFFVIATDSSSSSKPSSHIMITVPAEIKHNAIDDFETGSLSGWTTEIAENVSFADGLDSLYALELVNPENGSVGIEKIIDSDIAKSCTKLEFDIKTDGLPFFDEAAQVVFDQSGWKQVSLANYLESGIDSWQHVSIPLADFVDLDTNSAIAKMIFRFWSFDSRTYLLDNIELL